MLDRVNVTVAIENIIGLRRVRSRVLKSAMLSTAFILGFCVSGDWAVFVMMLIALMIQFDRIKEFKVRQAYLLSLPPLHADEEEDGHWEGDFYVDDSRKNFWR